MVTIISETYTIVHFILVCATMLTMLVLILALDYYKLQKRKSLIGTLVALLLLFGGLTLGIVVRDTVIMMTNATSPTISLGLHLVFIITGVYLIGACFAVFILERIKKVQSKRHTYTAIFTLLGIMLIGLIVSVVYLTFFVADPIEKNSLHIGSALGFPALILVSIGTLLVIQNESRFVLYHGLLAGSAWILTVMNVISLFKLSGPQMDAYSGWIHASHILFGAIGVITGFLSAFFGIAGQRKYAKLTGYITLGCWWFVYAIAAFIVNV